LIVITTVDQFTGQAVRMHVKVREDHKQIRLCQFGTDFEDWYYEIDSDGWARQIFPGQEPIPFLAGHTLLSTAVAGGLKIEGAWVAERLVKFLQGAKAG
jgi:hypothetical protein